MIIEGQTVKVTVPPNLDAFIAKFFDAGKTYARISVSSQDQTMLQAMKAAYRQAERLTRRAIAPQTIRCSFPGFCNEIILPRPPYISLTSFQYKDHSTEALTTVSSSLYSVDTEGLCAKIIRKDQASWPVLQIAPSPVQVTYQAGYADLGQIPEDLLQAIYGLAMYYYDNRGDVSTLPKNALPKTSDSVFRQYRIYVF